jgi:hypothetical protein
MGLCLYVLAWCFLPASEAAYDSERLSSTTAAFE